MTSPRFVIWAAVSSLPQAKKISLDDQVAEAQKHIERHGGQLVAELRVPGQSRSIVLFEDACTRIEAYAQLRDLIARKAFDVLIYLDRSRLGRTASLSMAVVGLCHEAGIVTYETESPPDTLALRTGHDDMLIGAIKSVGAQQEIEKLKERHRKGMIGRIKSGKMAGTPVYGYQLVYDAQGNQSVVINEAEAAIVRFVLIDCYLRQGMSHRQIAAELQRRNVPHPDGLHWTKARSQYMVKFVRRYAGYSEINRKGDRQYIIAPGNWEPIITDEEMNEVLAESESRKQPGRRHLSGRRFSRVCRCGACGAWIRVNAIQHSRIDGHEIVYYHCANRCKGAHIAESKLIASMEAVIEQLSHKVNRDAILRHTVPDRTGEITRQLDGISQHLANLERAKARLVRAYVELGALSDDEFTAQKERLDSEELALQAESARLVKERQRLDAEGQLGERLIDIGSRGRQFLHGPMREANQWLRRRVLLTIANGDVESVQYR